MARKPAAKKATAKRAASRKKKGLRKADVMRKGRQLSNWGKWGKRDQLGVLNYITQKDIVAASQLIKRGKVFRLGLELDENGPQRGLFGGRWNPMHQMLATGTDAIQGIQEPLVGMRYADDAINLPTQAASQWDALAHVFAGEKMEISVKRVEIDRTQEDGLICKDNMRADVKVAFFVRVNKTDEAVKEVATCLGCERASDQKALVEFGSAG